MKNIKIIKKSNNSIKILMYFVRRLFTKVLLAILPLSGTKKTLIMHKSNERIVSKFILENFLVLEKAP